MDTPIPKTGGLVGSALVYQGKGLRPLPPEMVLNDLARDRLLLELHRGAQHMSSPAARQVCAGLLGILESGDGYYYSGIPENDFLAMLDQQAKKTPALASEEKAAVHHCYTTAVQLQKKLADLREQSQQGDSAPFLHLEGVKCLQWHLKQQSRGVMLSYPEAWAIEVEFYEMLLHLFEPPQPNGSALKDGAHMGRTIVGQEEFQAVVDICKNEILEAYKVGLYQPLEAKVPSADSIQCMTSRLACCEQDALAGFAEALRAQGWQRSPDGPSAIGR